MTKIGISKLTSKWKDHNITKETKKYLMKTLGFQPHTAQNDRLLMHLAV